MSKNVAVVFGGSFNPPTLAHVNLLEEAIKQLDASFGVFIPASNNYVAKKAAAKGIDLIFSEEARFQMLRTICAKHNKMYVSTCEYGDDGKGHTCSTLAKIHNSLPNYKLVFLIGADNLHEIPTWRNSELMLDSYVEFAITNRNGIDIDEVINNDEFLTKYKDKFHKVLVSDAMSKISSTKVRKMTAEMDIESLRSMMDPDTIKFLPI